MTTTADTADRSGTAPPSGRRSNGAHPGPPPAAPLITFVVTFALGAFLGPLTGAGAPPSPFTSGTTVADWFAAHHTVAATSGWLTIVSVVALTFFAAVLHSRLLFLAPHAPGPVIAVAGALGAAVTLGVSGAGMWSLSRPEVTDRPELVRALYAFTFAVGGPAHTALLGMLVVGTAVTLWFVHRTPRWLSVVGIGLAAIDLLATLALLTGALAPLVPVGRFASLVWLVAVSLLVPRTRAARRPAGRPA